MAKLGVGLTGTHHVRGVLAAFAQAQRHWPKTSVRMEVRRHALKLRYWGDCAEGANPMVGDLDFEKIKTLHGYDVYELRIDEEIGGHKNIRIVFFLPPADWVPKKEIPLPPLWVLWVGPKKKQSWSKSDIATFKARAVLVRDQFFDW